MVSIVIAAHNEEAVLGATLDAVLADAPDADVIVVPNGCTDTTAAVARSRTAVHVVELPEGGKARALNAGEEAATSHPRIYLDADIVIPPGTVAALTRALGHPGVLAAVPGRRVDADGLPWPVRAWSRVHERLPVFRDGLFGRGCIALSEAGRARFTSFPEMVADDLFLDSLFTPGEKAHVDDVSVTVRPPRTTSELLHRLARVRRGSSAMRAALPGVRRPDRWSWWRDVVARDPRLLPSGVVYAGITALAALRARRDGSSSLDWGRRPARVTGPGRVGVLGLQCDTANLGLAALTYATVGILDELVRDDAEFVLFSINSEDALARMRQELGTSRRLRAVPFWHRHPVSMMRSIREIAGCDVVVDLTGGDSFSDIYGAKRLLRKLIHKELVLATGTPLVLGPQTYGPLRRRRFWGPWYRHVVERAALVVARDAPSAEFLATLTRRDVLVATDVAVRLPWRPPEGSRPTPARVLVNVSGLLWAGGYSGNNQFGLATDYREFCHGVVDGLLRDGHRVELVPHVLIRPGEPGGVEDDVAAARALLADHPRCELAPAFTSPVDAKSHIAGGDAFIGSRMHATIAAFTAGLPTIPVAYSRKFSGFFGSLGYPVTVDLTSTATAAAVTETLAHVRDRTRLATLAAPARDVASERIEVFLRALRDTLPVNLRN